MKKSLLVAVFALCAANAAHAAGNATVGKSKATKHCVACHGPDGNSMAPVFPKLAGQHVKYIAKQLYDFKAMHRTDQNMDPVVKKINAQDIEDIAAFFAGQSAKKGMGDVKLVDAGAKIYRGGNSATGVPACSSCHGPKGMGNPAANFPRVAGQHAMYTEKTLKDFRSGVRANDAGKMMQNIASKMSEAEIKAVAEFIAAIH